MRLFSPARPQDYPYTGRAVEAASDAERYKVLQGLGDPQAIFVALFGSLAHWLAGRDTASRRMLGAIARHTHEANWPRPVVLYLPSRLPVAEFFRAVNNLSRLR